jgi:radical SAM superfamily enzyme YgiQ (UPF0313 family)
VETVFVGAEHEENLSSRTMAAVARRCGRTSTVLAFNRGADLPAVLERILALEPSLVGLSMAFQHRAAEFLSLAAALRNEGFGGHIVAGGHFPTSVPAELLRHNPAVDTVVRHDGEEALAMLLERLDRPGRWSEVPSLSFRDGGEIRHVPPVPACRDLDGLPLPVRDTPLQRHLGVPFTTLCASRGCYGDCTFCAINSYHRSRPGPRMRFRSPAGVAVEMARLHHDKGARIFCFHDDTWFLPNARRMRRRMDELAAELERHGVRPPIAVVAKARPDAVDADLLAHLRRRLGLMRLYVGVENFSEAGLAHLGRRVGSAQVHDSLSTCLRAGVYSCYNLLLFEPDASLEDVEENIAGMRWFASVPVNFCRAEAYNGTALHLELKRRGRLRGNYMAADYEMGDPRVEMLFRIVYQAFKDRNFAADALANLNMSLGYELALLVHFGGRDVLPGIDELASEVGALTRDIVLDSVDRLEEAVRFVRSGGHRDGAGVMGFTVELASRVNFRGAELHTRLLSLRRSIERAAERLPDDVRPAAGRAETSTPPETMHTS